MSCLQSISTAGLDHALVQKKGKIEDYLDTAWAVQLIRGALLGLVLFLAAPLVGLFFKNAMVIPLIRTISLVPVINGFSNIGILYFKKELRFNRVFIYSSVVIITESVVSISFAIILRSLWALVLGSLAGALTALYLSYVFSLYRPKFAIDTQKLKELFRFGRWIMGSGILTFIILHGDDIFVGKFLGVAALGLYQVAYRISNMPFSEVTRVISNVTFPAYSKLQDNISRLREGFLKVLQITALVVFPMSTLIFILAHDFTRIFLGERWLPAALVMQVLSIWGLVRSLKASGGPIFRATGRPEVVTKLQFARLILLLGLLYPLTRRFGIIGTAWAVTITALLVEPVVYLMIIKTVRCRPILFIKAISIPTCATVLMGLAMYLVQTCVVKETTVPLFMLIIGTGILVYICSVGILDRLTNFGMIRLIKNSLALG